MRTTIFCIMILAAIGIVTILGSGYFFSQSEVQSENAEESPSLRQERGGVEITPKVANLGSLWRGDSATGNFSITNTSKQGLRILDIRLSCGCTKTKLSKRKLKPGETATLKVTYNSTGKNQKIERVAKPVTVVTNAARDNIVGLEINALVKPRFVIEPDFISMTGFCTSDLQDFEKNLSIHFVDDPSTLLKDVKTSVSWLTVRIEDVLQNQDGEVKKDWKLRLAVKSIPRYAGVNIAKVLLHTSNRKYPLIEVPVHFTVITDYQLIPDRLRFGIQEPGSTLRRTVRIRKRSSRDGFSIANIACSTDKIIIKKVTQGVSKEHSFDVCATTPARTGKFSGMITVHLDNEPDMILPVSGFVRPPRDLPNCR